MPCMQLTSVLSLVTEAQPLTEAKGKINSSAPKGWPQIKTKQKTMYVVYRSQNWKRYSMSYLFPILPKKQRAFILLQGSIFIHANKMKTVVYSAHSHILCCFIWASSIHWLPLKVTDYKTFEYFSSCVSFFRR